MEFSSDFINLEDAADQFNQMQTNATDMAAKEQQALARIASKGNPDERVYAMIALIYGYISPSLESSEAPYGAAEKIQADIQKCSNDIHDITNSKTGSVLAVAQDTDQMLGILNPTTGNANILAADGSATNNSLFAQFQAIRNDIYTGGSSPYGPTSSVGCHFDISTDGNPNGEMTSYAEMQANMGLPGDPGGANAAYHIILNAGNTNTSTLTTATNVATTNLKLFGSEDKEWLSFGNNMVQELKNIDKAAQQHLQNANG